MDFQNQRWGTSEFSETNSISDFPPPSGGVGEEFINPLLNSSRLSAESSGSGEENVREGLIGATSGGGLGGPSRGNQGNPGNDRSFRRPLPQPRPFEGNGDRSIKNFFTTFERYACSMWGTRKSDWVAGLEANLQGWALVLYRGLVDQGRSYEKIKTDLLTAFPGVVDPFRTRNLLKLVNLKRELKEPLTVFLLRIDQILRETYPDLTDESHALQVRDTFLMKLDSSVALKIANFCNARGDFSPQTVRESANLISLSEIPSGRDETIFFANAGGKMGTEAPIKEAPVREGNGLRCYICAGHWHPVSTCPLYPMVFSCPLCRGEPHPITDCSLYEEFKKFRSFSGVTTRQAQGWDENRQQRVQDRHQYNDRQFDRQRYQANNWRGTPHQYQGRYDYGAGRASVGEYRSFAREYRTNRDRSYDQDRSRDRSYENNYRRSNPPGNINSIRRQGASQRNSEN